MVFFLNKLFLIFVKLFAGWNESSVQVTVAKNRSNAENSGSLGGTYFIKHINRYCSTAARLLPGEPQVASSTIRKCIQIFYLNLVCELHLKLFAL